MPSRRQRASVAAIASPGNASVTSKKTLATSRRRPGATSILPSRVRFSACLRSGRRPRPTTPTRPTSPSSSAFTACVVEWVTSSMRSAPTLAATSATARTTPAATPAGSRCVVGNTAVAITVPEASDRATALVNVPPTSTPMRTLSGLVMRSRRGDQRRAAHHCPKRSHHERVERAQHVHDGERDLRQDRCQRGPISGGLREKDRQPRPTVEAVIRNDVGGLQSVQCIAEERDRCRHHHRYRDVHECAHRQSAARVEDEPCDERQRDDGQCHTQEDETAEAATEAEDGLVEKRRLEAFAVDRGEANGDQRRGRSDRDRRPQPSANELHPTLLFETLDE